MATVPMSHGQGFHGQDHGGHAPDGNAHPAWNHGAPPPAQDFLGLDCEIAPPSAPDWQMPGRFPSPPAPFVPRQAAPAMPSPSWLMQLDDAKAGRAGHGPVVAGAPRAPVAAPAPLVEASYSEHDGERLEIVPWLVRGLVGAAAVCFAIVLVQAFRIRSHDSTPTVSAPLAPAPASSRSRSVDDEALESPGRGSLAGGAPTSARPSPRGTFATSPATLASDAPSSASLPVAVDVPSARADGGSTAEPVRSTEPAPVASSSASAKEPRADAAELPAWWPGAFPRSSPAHDESVAEASSDRATDARERLDRWLLVNSRSAAPIADALAIDTRPESATGAKPAASAKSADVFDETWKAATIPIERVVEDVRIATPAVGRVRCTLKSGEPIEGALVALGKGRLWLDANVGRIDLAASDVARIEPTSPRTTAQDLSELPRMRVRTPGRTYYGKVVERGGGVVVLVTDAGERVRLQTEDVEPAPPRAATQPPESAATTGQKP